MRPGFPAPLALASLLSISSVFACGGGPLGPDALDTKNDACAWCRMGASDARFAAQLVATSEELRFFDDIGCLAAFLAARPVPKGSLAFVADHRTKAWAPAPGAVYTRNPGLQTPMSSHLLAHADAASREADPDARGGTAESAATIFGAAR
jgi:copper chaperone NosL